MPVVRFYLKKKKKPKDGPRDCHTERSKLEREKQISYINAYMWNLEKMVQMKLFAGQK